MEIGDRRINKMNREYRKNKSNKSTTTGKVVNADKVNIRKEPNINSEVLGVVNYGDKFPIVGNDNRGFYTILFQGKPAFIHSGYFMEV